MPTFQGFTRLRKIQVGKQTSFASNAPATRILPWAGAIDFQPNRTQPEVDLGSIDPILASFNGPTNITLPASGKLDYDSAPYLWAALLKGGVTPTGGGAAKTWTFQAASLTADDYEYLSVQQGDDSNGISAGGGIVDSGSVGFADDEGAYDFTAAFVMARAVFATNPFTGGLTADVTPNWIYGADTEVYLDTVAANIGTTKLTDDVHSMNLAINGNNDQKRFANGSNTRFQIAGYGRGAREGTLTLVRAETTAAIAERARLDDEPVITSYFEAKATSPEIITGSTPYSQSIRLALELLTCTPGNIGGNVTLEFTYRVKYDPTLLYAYKVVDVCALTTL